MSQLEIRVVVEVPDNIEPEDFRETIESILAFGSEEDIDDHVPYDIVDCVEILGR